jgi:glutamyl-tRNA synthetase
VEAALRGFAESEGWPPRELYMTVRLAVTGRAATPPLFETLAVLGKEVTRRRLRRAAEVLR